MTSVLTYNVPHKILNITELLGKAKHVADIAVAHKLKEDERSRKFAVNRMMSLNTYIRQHELCLDDEDDVNWVLEQFDAEQTKLGIPLKFKRQTLSSKHVKHIGLASAIAGQVLRKYGRGTIKEASNVNLIVPGQVIKYNHADSLITLTMLNNYKFKWNPVRQIVKINQIEINATTIFVTVTCCDAIPFTPGPRNVIGVDLNATHHVAAVACLANNKVWMIGKQGPSIRKQYHLQRQKAQTENNKKMLKKMAKRETKRLRNMDHKISSDIVKLALEHKSVVVLEDLKGIRNRVTVEGHKATNRLINTWSYYRLQQFIEYKCKLNGVPFAKVPPEYTSQLCSYCGVLGNRNRKHFTCINDECDNQGIERHADVNAAFNIARRYLGEV